ncbi:MAG: ribonuclease P protein component [Rhizobiaceae bacterium]|nr:ribonuclease P protein component [Rhizobiaceae bacterium]
MVVKNFQLNSRKTVELVTLKKRSQFVAMKSGVRIHARAFVLQARQRQAGETKENLARFGFTVTKRVGNSVVRNRIKRRLRAVVGQCCKDHANADCDYVLIGKRAALSENFTTIVKELRKSLDRSGAVGANPDRKSSRENLPKLEQDK